MWQLELDLWDVLRDAAAEPEDADFSHLFGFLDSTLLNLDSPTQLQVAAEAIAQIVQIFEDRSFSTFEELESQTSEDGPIVPPDFFDRFVRQSMQVNLAQFIELPALLLPRAEQERLADGDAGESIVGTVDKESLLEVLEQVQQMDDETAKQQALAVAHEEDISAWIEAIAAYLKSCQPGRVALLELVQGVHYLEEQGTQEHGTSLVKTWITLLLGGFRLEQPGEFYSSEVWVVTGEG